MPEQPKVGGSFGGSRLASQIRAQKEEETITDLKVSSGPEKAEESEDAPKTRAGRMLPEKITCFLGDDTPYEDFRTFYDSVYDQVSTGSHLVSGRVRFSTSIGETAIEFRSLKKKEVSFLQLLVPFFGDDYIRAVPQLDVYQLMFGVTRIGDVKIPEVPIDSKNIEGWLDSKNVKQFIEFFEEMDETFTAVLMNIQQDVAIAKRLAFMELVPNP